MVGRQRMSAIRLAWLDCRTLEQFCALDYLEWVHGDDYSNECGDYHGEWECAHYYGIWAAGRCC
jgi:hypothetical protein